MTREHTSGGAWREAIIEAREEAALCKARAALLARLAETEQGASQEAEAIRAARAERKRLAREEALAEIVARQERRRESAAAYERWRAIGGEEAEEAEAWRGSDYAEERARLRDSILEARHAAESARSIGAYTEGAPPLVSDSAEETERETREETLARSSTLGAALSLALSLWREAPPEERAAAMLGYGEGGAGALATLAEEAEASYAYASARYDGLPHILAVEAAARAIAYERRERGALTEEEALAVAARAAS